MGIPLGGGMPPLVSSEHRIIIELYPTPALDVYHVQVFKVGLDDKGWDFVLTAMADAVKPVVQALMQSRGSQPMVLPARGERL